MICKLILKKNSLVSAKFGKFNLAALTVLLHFPSWVITRTNRKQIFIISVKDAMLKLAFSRSIRALVIKISFYLCMCTFTPGTLKRWVQIHRTQKCDVNRVNFQLEPVL